MLCTLFPLGDRPACGSVAGAALLRRPLSSQTAQLRAQLHAAVPRRRVSTMPADGQVVVPLRTREHDGALWRCGVRLWQGAVRIGSRRGLCLVPNPCAVWCDLHALWTVPERMPLHRVGGGWAGWKDVVRDSDGVAGSPASVCVGCVD